MNFGVLNSLNSFWVFFGIDQLILESPFDFVAATNDPQTENEQG